MNNFSVVIPTLNEYGYIDFLLKDLQKQTIKPKKILIIDGNSSDGTINKAVLYKNVEVIKVKPQVSLQRNLGARRSKTDIIVFLDADTRLSDDFLEKSLSQFDQKKLDFACPFFIPDTSNAFIYLVYLFFNLIFFLFQKILPSGAGSCIIAKRKAFLDLKGFDQKFKFEDVEFIRRAVKKYNFGMLNTYLLVSDRRFRKYGIIKTTFKYILISFFSVFSQFKIANNIDYQFGKYNEP